MFRCGVRWPDRRLLMKTDRQTFLLPKWMYNWGLRLICPCVPVIFFEADLIVCTMSDDGS